MWLSKVIFKWMSFDNILDSLTECLIYYCSVLAECCE